jgi:hypothetical protein
MTDRLASPYVATVDVATTDHKNLGAAQQRRHNAVPDHRNHRRFAAAHIPLEKLLGFCKHRQSICGKNGNQASNNAVLNWLGTLEE